MTLTFALLVSKTDREGEEGSCVEAAGHGMKSDRLSCIHCSALSSFIRPPQPPQHQHKQTHTFQQSTYSSAPKLMITSTSPSFLRVETFAHGLAVTFFTGVIFIADARQRCQSSLLLARITFILCNQAVTGWVHIQRTIFPPAASCSFVHQLNEWVIAGNVLLWTWRIPTHQDAGKSNTPFETAFCFFIYRCLKSFNTEFISGYEWMDSWGDCWVMSINIEKKHKL